MNKYDKYKIQPSQESPVNKWDKYKTTPFQEKAGDSWPALIGKSVFKGAGYIADLPNLAAQGLEGLARGQAEAQRRKFELMGYPGSDIETPEIDILSRNIPTSDDARGYVKSRTGIDLEPRPTTLGQRVASHATEFAGSLGPWGMIGKGAGALNAAKFARTGAGIGATSGVLQEGGVDPLVADIGSSFASPFAAAAAVKSIKGTGNLLHKFTTAGQKKQVASAAGDILKDRVGEKNIQKVIKNLNAQTPFDTKLTTAELAQNTGIAGLDRALSPNVPAIAEKQALADSIMKKQLNMLSPKVGLDPEKQGEAIRDYLSKELKSRKQIRGDVTEPLYQKVNQIRQGVDLPNTQAFLQREGEFAKGDIKKNLNYVEDIIRSNTTSKRDVANVDKLYSNLGQGARLQLQKEVSSKPVPVELTNALKDISGRIGAAKKSGNHEVARVLSEAKSNLLKDMAQIPEEEIARSAYARLSKPVSAIEKEPLLGKIVKKDVFNQEFLTSPEKIPDMILRGSLDNTRALVSQVGKNKKTMDIIKGSVVDKLLHTSELSSINASGQQNLSYNKVNNFLTKNKRKLEYIFDKDQVKVLEDVKGILKRRNMVATMGRGVGSNTQSQTTLLEGLTNPVKQSIGKKLINKIPGGKYLTPVYDMAKDYEKQQIISLLEKALLDPDTAKLLLTPVSSIKNEQSLKSILTRVGIPAAAYSLSKPRQKENE
jgi:hypothetical protein